MALSEDFKKIISGEVLADTATLEKYSKTHLF